MGSTEAALPGWAGVFLAAEAMPASRQLVSEPVLGDGGQI
jgi:hypothetical protein